MENNYSKNTHLRPKGSTSDGQQKIDHSIEGWFSNKHNLNWGWVITKLDDYDLAWLKEQNVDSTNVRRVYAGGSNNTSLVRFNFTTGTYAFADNEALLQTDKLTFQVDRRYRKCFLDLL